MLQHGHVGSGANLKFRFLIAASWRISLRTNPGLWMDLFAEIHRKAVDSSRGKHSGGERFPPRDLHSYKLFWTSPTMRERTICSGERLCWMFQANFQIEKSVGFARKNLFGHSNNYKCVWDSQNLEALKRLYIFRNRLKEVRCQHAVVLIFGIYWSLFIAFKSDDVTVITGAVCTSARMVGSSCINFNCGNIFFGFQWYLISFRRSPLDDVRLWIANSNSWMQMNIN